MGSLLGAGTTLVVRPWNAETYRACGIPGIGETIRVVGRAALSIEPDLLASFAVNGKAASCVIVVTVEHVFYQCTKAIVRSKLWDPARHVDRKRLPTTGAILAAQTAGR